MVVKIKSHTGFTVGNCPILSSPVLQNTVNRIVSVVLSMAKDVPLWQFAHLHHKQLQVPQTTNMS